MIRKSTIAEELDVAGDIINYFENRRSVNGRRFLCQ